MVTVSPRAHRVTIYIIYYILYNKLPAAASKGT